MIPKVMRPFVSELQKATEAEKLSWYQGDERSYICDHKNHTLHITSHFDHEDGEMLFIFNLVTGEKNTPFTVKDGESDYDTMRDLYESVIANANDVSKDIDGFFD
jgi:hypothetical protein